MKVLNNLNNVQLSQLVGLVLQFLSSADSSVLIGIYEKFWFSQLSCQAEVTSTNFSRRNTSVCRGAWYKSSGFQINITSIASFLQRMRKKTTRIQHRPRGFITVWCVQESYSNDQRNAFQIIIIFFTQKMTSQQFPQCSYLPLRTEHREGGGGGSALEGPLCSASEESGRPSKYKDNATNHMKTADQRRNWISISLISI